MLSSTERTSKEDLRNRMNQRQRMSLSRNYAWKALWKLMSSRSSTLTGLEVLNGCSSVIGFYIPGGAVHLFGGSFVLFCFVIKHCCSLEGCHCPVELSLFTGARRKHCSTSQRKRIAPLLPTLSFLEWGVGTFSNPLKRRTS